MPVESAEVVSRAAHRRIYSFFTALRAPSFYIYLYKHTFPLPQLVQAVTGCQTPLSLSDNMDISHHMDGVGYARAGGRGFRRVNGRETP
jgi:hypothetical protein